MTMLYLSRVMLLIVGLNASLLARCGASSDMRFEGSWQIGKLTPTAPDEVWAWKIQPDSASIALLMDRSAGTSDRTADNEDLVVELTMAEFTAGKPVALESPARIVHYLRGGQKPGYASTTIKGSLSFERTGDRLRGEVSLTASAPTVNVSGDSGVVSRRFSFELDRK